MTTPNDNPFEPNHAYSKSEFCAKAALCQRSVDYKLASGELKAVKIGVKTVITNAHQWFADLPRYVPGQGRRVGRKAA